MAKRSFVATGFARVAMRRRRMQVSYALRAMAGYFVEPTPERAALLRLLMRRSTIVVALLGALMCVLLGRAIFLASSPFVRLQAALVVANTEPRSIDRLVEHAQALTKMMANIENTSLGDIQSALKDTVALSERVAIDSQAQHQAWARLRGQIKNDSSTYEDLRAQLAEVQKLQEQEVVRLKRMLEAAQRPTVWSDVFGQLWAFALGVVSSIVASWLYMRWEARSAAVRSVNAVEQVQPWSWLRWF